MKKLLLLLALVQALPAAQPDFQAACAELGRTKRSHPYLLFTAEEKPALLQRIRACHAFTVSADGRTLALEFDDDPNTRWATDGGTKSAWVARDFGRARTFAGVEIKEAFADPRRTEIVARTEEISVEDLIQEEEVVITVSHTGYIKSQAMSEYRAQRRGGRGKQATATKEEDWIDQLFIANTHDYILCFSNRGRLYWLKVWEVPAGSRGSRGRPIVNMFPLAEGEKINVVLPLTGEKRSFPEDQYIFMATRMGTSRQAAGQLLGELLQQGLVARAPDPRRRRGATGSTKKPPPKERRKRQSCKLSAVQADLDHFQFLATISARSTTRWL